MFAAAVDAATIREVALLPFQYDPTYGRFDYEPADIVRAGPELEPLDPLAELSPVRPRWAGRCQRVLALASLSDPVLVARTVHNHLIIALDGATAAVAERLNPGVRRPPLVELSAAVPSDAFGVPFEALLGAYDVCGPVGSLPALRQAALLGRLLELQAPAGPHRGRPLLEHVLFSVAPPDALAPEAEGSSDAQH